MKSEVTNTRPLRVCHVITGLGQGGAENALCRLVEGDRFNNQVTVVSLTGRGFHADRLEAAGARVMTLSISGLSSLVSALFRLRRIYKETRPEVIQTWMYHADLLGGIVARCMGIPVAWGLRQSNLSGEHVKAGTRLVAKLSALFSGMLPTVIVACAHRVAQYHRSIGYQGRMVVIPNGLDLSGYRSDSANAASMREALGLGDAFVVCHVGRADTQKDHATLLTAFKLFLAKHPGSRLLLIGAGLEEKSGYLERLNDYSTIETNVLALGPRQDVPALMQISDVFSLSSVSEGFPNVVAEAMASGVPCVVTDCGDAAEMVGDTGWTVPVKDAEAMAQAFSDASAESQSQRALRKRAARSRAEQMFDLQSMVYAYQRVWLEMVK